MMHKQGQARVAQRLRHLYLPPADLPVFCALCDVDAATGLCPVCLRNLEEIMGWPRLNEDGRRAVWGRVQTRLVAAREDERAARRALALRRSVPRVVFPPEPPPWPEALPLPDPEAGPVEAVVAGNAGEDGVAAEDPQVQAAPSQEAGMPEMIDPSGAADAAMATEDEVAGAAAPMPLPTRTRVAAAQLQPLV